MEYTELKNKLKYEVRNLKNELWEKKCADINAQIRFNRSKQAWNVIREMRGEESHRINLNFIRMEE